MPSNTWKEVCKFIGLFHYYFCVWFRRIYMLLPLTDLMSNKVTFKWTHTNMYKSFDTVKWILYRNNLLAYPHFNK